MCHPKYFVKLLLVSCFVLIAGFQIVCTQSTTQFSLNPVTPGSQTPRECLTRNGTKGLCVHEKFCTADHRVAIYGIIDDSELREKQCRESEWCCVLPNNDDDSGEQTEAPVKNENNGTTVNEATSTACTPIEFTDCPWCVTLHKGTLNDMFETGLYCMGTMIGPNIVLTSSSCILAAQNITMWAQVPNSAKPKQKYGVRYTKQHPNYNSGTHEFDYGLVILQEDVNWGQRNWIGACLGLQTAVEGDCIGFGFDGNSQIVSTLLTSTPGGCTESGNTTDVSCSKKYVREEYCIIAPGSPVSCKGSGDVRGVARISCYGDAALVGSLSLSRDWIAAELKTLNVLPNNYLIKRS